MLVGLPDSGCLSIRLARFNFDCVFCIIMNATQSVQFQQMLPCVGVRGGPPQSFCVAVVSF